MFKRFLSMVLTILLTASLFTACSKNGDVSDGESTDVGVQDGSEIENPNNKEDLGDETQPDIKVIELNFDLFNNVEPLHTETSEKVLKLTAESTENSAAKYILINIDSIQVPVGSTLEYDVYLETATPYLGLFEMRLGNLFMSVSGEIVDAAGVGLNVKSSDISGQAYGRWYRRVFDLDYTEIQNSRDVRFPVCALYGTEKAVCYYDNICIKDSNGVVIYTVDENYIADYEIRQSKGLTCTFEVVDDPNPTAPRLVWEDMRCIPESLGTVSDGDSIEAVFTVNSIKSAPAIYVGEKDSNCPWGIKGLVLVAKDNYLTLYRSGETVTELASALILGFESGKDASLKLEIVGDVVRGYWLDDMDGVEPWPEFELAVEGLQGKNFGVMDVYGQNTVAKTVSLGKCKVENVEKTYVNPVLDDFADPDVLLYDGVYYMYGTMGPGYKVYSSTDLVNWEYRGQCMENNFWGWENNGLYWAPDVEYHNGKFYMVCSINQHLGIAVADSPLGPFIADETYLFPSTIDGNLFIDDDGQAYLYYVSNRPGVEYGIYGAKFDLETHQVDLATEVCVINDTEKWETYDDENIPYESQVCEGPYMLKHNGLYYLTYSGSDYKSVNYAVGYGVSKSPLGPFEKYKGNPIHIGNSAVHGTAHHCFTETLDGELLIVYHQHKNVNEVELRKISIDKARFVPTESGIDRLETYGPTTTPQPMPLG